jgi:hypothetical protein
VGLAPQRLRLTKKPGLVTSNDVSFYPPSLLTALHLK